MSSTTKTTYERTWTCDRCKVQFRSFVEGSPEGWEYLINNEDERFDLCPACCVSFGHWMSNPANLNIHINLDHKQVSEMVEKELGKRFTQGKLKTFDPRDGCPDWTFTTTTRRPHTEAR